MIKFSIIIPLFNTERYIGECIKSVINQNYASWELIIINDGSSDKSLEIANKFASEDKRIKVYSQRNNGVSSARNYGLKKAIGEYVMFLDSDDWYEENLLKSISVLKDDFICYGFNKRFKNRVVEKCDSSIELLDKNTVLNYIHSSSFIEGYLTTKVFKNSIIKQHDLKLDTTIHYCEDLLFVDEYINYCDSYRYLPHAFYNYRMRKSSVTFSSFGAKTCSILMAYRRLIDRYSDNKPICDCIKYKYLLNYYKMKKFVEDSEHTYARDVLSCENDIMKSVKLSNYEKLIYTIIKRANSLYLILKNLKDFNLMLYK